MSDSDLTISIIRSAARLAQENERLRKKVRKLQETTQRDLDWLKLCLASLRTHMESETRTLDMAVDADRERLERIEARLATLEAQP